jgi:hypothetical protein
MLADIGSNSIIKIPQVKIQDSIQNTTLKPSTIYEDNNASIILVTTEANFKP